MTIEIRQLRYAVATADTKSFSRAASALNVKQSTLSKRIAAFEEQLGVKLSASRIEPPAGTHVLQAGSIIPAALITGIRSDLPGQVTAQVTEPVYDSVTGRILLIPQGSRLIGDYNADVSFGQRRMQLTWNRLILPDGRSVVLERQPGGEAQQFQPVVLGEHVGPIAVCRQDREGAFW